jgi:hypothetical protein
MSWKDAASGWSNWRNFNERRGFSPSVRRSDGGGHVNALSGKGVTPARLMRRPDETGEHVEHEGQTGSFSAFPQPSADDGDLLLTAPSAAQAQRERIAGAAAAAGSRSDNRSDSRGSEGRDGPLAPIRAFADNIRRIVTLSGR